MTAYDDLLDQLDARMDRLPVRAQVAFFASCADALATLLDEAGAERSDTLTRAIRWARDVARGAPANGQASQLLEEVTSETPGGDSAPTVVQDAWICADAAVRVVAEPGTSPGPWVEFALEPRMQAVTEAMYDVLQLGSDDEHLVDNVLSDPRFAEAVEFCDWALSLLEAKDTVSEDDLRQLADRATALVP
jgi:hypothetical protein